MRRIFVIPLIVALLMVLTVALTTTGAGLRLVARIVMPMAPGQITFASLDGRLIGPLSVTDLTWESQAGQLSIAQLDLDWQPARLPSRHLYIDRLTASHVRWSASEPGPAANDREAPGPGPLPLSVTVAALEIDDIRIDSGATTLVIDTLQLAGEVNDKHYTLDNLVLRTPALDVSGNATVAADRPHDLNAELTWVARLENAAAPIGGIARAHGDMDQLQIELATDGPVSLALSALASDILDAPRLEGKLEIDRFNPAMAGLDFETGELSATLGYRISRDGFSLDGRMLAPGLWPATVIISTDALLNDNTLMLNKLNLTAENWPAVIDISGTVQTDLSDLNLQLGWTDLVWPPGDQPRFASPDGTATLTGSKDRYELQLNATTENGLMPAARVSLRGQGRASQFEIMAMNAQFPSGSIDGHGLLNWAAVPQARLDIVSRDLELSQWHEQLEGRLGFDGTVDASLPPGGAQASAELRRVDGQLRGFPLSGSGAVDYAPGNLEIRRLEIRAGQARIEANGRVGDELDLAWNLNIPDIALFLPGGTGLLRSQGKASGQRNQPGLVGNLAIRDLKFGKIAAATLDSRFDIGVSAASPAQISLDASGITIDGVLIDTVKGGASGTVAQHAIEVEIDGSTLELDTLLEGGVDAGVWRGQITKLISSRSDIGVWRLQEATPLAIQPERIMLKQFCLAQRDARLCVDGELATNEPWRTEFTLTALPIEAFAGMLPPGLIYQGLISGNGHIASAESGWAGTVALLLPEGRVISREDDEDDVLIAYQNGSIESDFDRNQVQARLKLDLRDAGAVDANIVVPAGAGQPLQGTVQARVDNLSLVTALMPQIGRIDGRIETNLVLAGTLAAPDLSGQVDLQAREIVLPDLGITLQDTTVAVVTKGTELRFDGSAGSGPGRVSLTGALRWNQGRPVGQLSLNGEQFRALDLPEVSLDASPALTLTVDGPEISLGGSLAVPAARITPIDFSTGTTVSPDQIIIGQPGASKPETPWVISGSVQVTAGDSVKIKGYGLEGNLTGSVLIIEAPNQPTIGRGALEIVDGHYRAYGQELAIETGRLEFTGGQIDDPGLNLRAARTSGDIVAGVQVRGALRRPVLTLYSVPAMSDSQAMSYLITGRGLEELNEIDQTAVSDAATRLALRGGSLLASSLGRELGLDSVGFEDTGETASTALVVGKHLTPRLFVSYGIGLFEAINTLRLRYRINSRLTLETQSGTSTSADLLYTMER